MFDIRTLLTFLVAATAIILAPGPAQALVISRTLSEGRKAGVLTAIGLNCATIVHAMAASLGLSAILATSASAFSFVKYLGATYLAYLGLKALFTKEARTERPSRSGKMRFWRDLAKAFLTGILNPKVALFFLAFLPQFVDRNRGSVFMQFLVLAGILAVMDVIYESFLAFVFSAMNARTHADRRFALWRQRISGGVLLGLGIRLALIGQK
jgi:threonine/homoserine/homoserine lactone efflux protein